MSRVWHIAFKELLQTRRDRLAALFTLILPVIFTVFLGIMIGRANEDSGLPLALADRDGSEASQTLALTLSGSPALAIRQIALPGLEDAVRSRKVAAGLVIPVGYETALQAGQTVSLDFVCLETVPGAQSARQAVESVLFESHLSSLAIKSAAHVVTGATGLPFDDRLDRVLRESVTAALAQPTVTLDVTDAGRPLPGEASGFEQSSPGGMVNWVLFGLLTVVAGVAWEKQRGLLRRFLAAGVKQREIVAGKLLAMVAVTFLQQLLLATVGQVGFGVRYFHAPLALLATMLSLSIFAASFGLLLSSLFRREQAIIAVTIISAQLLGVMGGAWFPLEVASHSFSRAAHFFPTAWIMECLHGITLSGWGMTQVLVPLGYVWAWIAVVFSLAVWRFRPD